MRIKNTRDDETLCTSEKERDREFSHIMPSTKKFNVSHYRLAFPLNTHFNAEMNSTKIKNAKELTNKTYGENYHNPIAKSSMQYLGVALEYRRLNCMYHKWHKLLEFSSLPVRLRLAFIITYA